MGRGAGVGALGSTAPPPALVRPQCRRGPSVRSRVCSDGLIGNSLSADGRRRGKFFCFFFVVRAVQAKHGDGDVDVCTAGHGELDRGQNS